MATDSPESVERALSSVDVTVERTPRESFAATVASVTSDPAVGVPLEAFDVSLADAPVTVDPTPAELKAATTGVTPATRCVREYGTLVLPEREGGAGLVSLFVERHVVLLREEDVVETMEAGFDALEDPLVDDRESAILATGPSATADMGALVTGAHGPREVVAVVLEGDE